MNRVDLILGTMTFGESVFSPDVERFIGTFMDYGFNEFDTAYVYNEGRCEQLRGEVLKSVGRPFRLAPRSTRE